MKKDLNKAIEEMADKMEKASTDPKEKLATVIKSLGSKGLKEKLATLSEEDKLVLKATLEEMTLTKAVEFDKEAQGAKVINGKESDTIIQEEIASDDADEKLVKPAAAAMSHQGTPTDGWEGQVIKSIQENEAAMDQVIEKAMEKCSDDKMIMKKLKEKGMEEGKVQGALDRYKAKKNGKAAPTEEVEKAMSKDAAKDKLMQMEEKEHGTKDPKKLVDAEKKEHEVKKAVQTEIEPTETNQSGDAPNLEGGKSSAKKTSAPDIEDNAKANKKNMTKSLTWEDDTRLLKANTQGRNFTFNVEQFVTETLASEPRAEEIKKSEKLDTNDMIEKSMDRGWDQVNAQELAAKNDGKAGGKLVKSFEDNELAAILGLTEEEAKKILG